MQQKNPTISTSQMMSEIASKFEQLPKKITKEVIVTFLNSIENGLAEGKKIRIDKIGILQVKERAPRMGRNPQTGEQIKIPESKKISYRVSKSLKQRVLHKPAKKK